MKTWLPGEYYHEVLGTSCKKPFDARLKWPRPHLDDKVIVMRCIDGHMFADLQPVYSHNSIQKKQFNFDAD
nr:spermatogenesis-associated protein 20 isoform X2 [Tanacetum cinerariifolium]